MIPPPRKDILCDNSVLAAQYWNEVVKPSSFFNPCVECAVVVLLNTRRRVTGHQLVSTGTLDSTLCTPREVFRGAVKAAASAIILLHNHPSGDPSPSPADVTVTADLADAGKVLKIDLLDHIIMGDGRHASLRDLGYIGQASARGNLRAADKLPDALLKGSTDHIDTLNAWITRAQSVLHLATERLTENVSSEMRIEREIATGLHIMADEIGVGLHSAASIIWDDIKRLRGMK